MQRFVYAFVVLVALVVFMIQGNSQVDSNTPMDCILNPVDIQIRGRNISCDGTGSVKAAAVIFLQDFEGLEGSFRNPTNNIPGAPGLRYENDSNKGRLQFRNDFVFRETTMATLDNPGGESINWLIQQIDLSAYQGANDLVLDFWWYDHGDEGDAPDIVEIRGDITQPWIEVYDFAANTNNGDWSYANIDLDEALGSQTLGSTFEIRFGQNDNFPVNTDGISIDDLTIFREGQSYSFLWSTGDNMVVEQPVDGSFYYSTVEDLSAGTYTVTVTGESGCTNIASVTIEDNILTAVCDDITVELDNNGEANVLPAEVGGNSIVACGLQSENLSQTFFDCTDAGTVATVTYAVTDASGNSDNCTANVTINIDNALPSIWIPSDIGSNPQGTAYSFNICSNAGEFTITGSGNNATSITTDNVAFTSQTFCGDAIITAKIESVTPNGYGGLMIRETSDAGAKQVSIFSNLTNSLRHESRYTNNGFKQVNNFFKPSPIWLRLERQGDWIFAYYSATGSNFQYVHGVYLPMQDCVEIGLAGFTYAPNGQTDVVFSHVSVSGSNGGFSEGGTTLETKPSKPASTSLNLSLYPNPNAGHFTLQLEQAFDEDTRLEIYNLFGQKIAAQILPAQTSVMEWNIEGTPAGTYWLGLETNGQKQLVKQFVITD